MVLAISLVLTVALNVDSLLILQKLNTQPGVRDSLVAQAKAFSEQPSATHASAADSTTPASTTGDDSTLRQNFQFVRGQLDELALPIGWFGSPDPNVKTDPIQLKAQSEYRTENALWAPWAQGGDFWNTVRFHVLGWLLTAIAASLGAPFWFDMLNKFMSIRSAGKAPEEMPKAPKVVPVPTDPGR